MEIYFSSLREVIYFCEYMYEDEKQLDLHWENDVPHGHRVIITDLNLTDSIVESISKAFVNIYYTYHISKVLQRVLRKNYYYTNQFEIEKIIEHAYIILFEHKENPVVKKLKKNLQAQFSKIVCSSNPLYFETIIHFQLTNLKDHFIELIGLAIDDFKQEELHQQFIHNIRVFMKNKKTNYKEVHIVQGSPFSYYNETGDEITQKKVDNLLEKEPLYLLGLSTPDYYLSPLIAMAPEKIYIYGDNIFEAKTQSIMNVFQEKVVFHDISTFPFKQLESKN